MKIWKFNKSKYIDKSIGHVRITTINYGLYANGKHKSWSELRLWYDEDCEHCPFGWECRSYEGECDDCGCMVSKDGDFGARLWWCMMPTWMKNIVVSMKRRKHDV